MARALTTQDAYQIINLMVKEATGQDATIQAVDTSSFVAAGETLLAAGTEATLNALSMVLGRTFVAVRPYNAKFGTVNAINSGLFANRLRKISFYARPAVPDGSENTQLHTNLKTGFDNGVNGTGTAGSTPSMWEQFAPMPLEMNFSGSSEWQTVTTVYEKQLQVAFRSEGDFISFVNGIMTEKGNDIESMKEAFQRMTVLNAIAGVIDLNQGGSAINLTAEFNAENGTSYTTADLLGPAHFTEFLEFFVSFIKIISDRMENRSKKYHWSVDKTVDGETYSILRHTPKDKQKLMLYKPFWYKLEARKAVIFNEEYLSIDNFEGVDYWQNELDPSAIDVTPAIPNISNPTAQTAGDRVQLDYVLGFLFDEDACMVDYQFDDATTTPLEARKHYRNLWWTVRRNAINDFSENMIVFYMADGE